MKKKYYKDYKYNQYEDIDLEYVPMGGIEARYIEMKDPEFKGKRLNEAINPPNNVEQIFEKILHLPIYSGKERNESDMHRLQAIGRLGNLRYPFVPNIEVDTLLNFVLHEGYRNKDIDSVEYTKEVNVRARDARTQKKIDLIRDNKTLLRKNAKQALGFLIMGISGAGKSTAIDTSLSKYPQVLTHTNDKYSEYKQLVWIKIDCSYNGSLKGICLKIFSEMDRALGTNWLDQFEKKNMNVDRMILAIKHLSIYYGLGTLVIDEIQNLRINKECISVLNFFLSLSNELNLPIIYVGTYEASTRVFSQNFRQARRGMGVGVIEFGYLPREDYDDLIEILWSYQWTREEAELTQEIKDLIYEKSIGITDRIIKLFVAAQIAAIIDGSEKLNYKLIENVAETKFTLTKDMIRAFKAGDIYKLTQIDDMNPFSINEAINDATEVLKARESLRQYQENKMHLKEISKQRMMNELYTQFACFGYEAKLTEQVVRNIVNKHFNNKSQEEIVRLIANKLLHEGNKNKDNKQEGKEL